MFARFHEGEYRFFYYLLVFTYKNGRSKRTYIQWKLTFIYRLYHLQTQTPENIS